MANTTLEKTEIASPAQQAAPQRGLTLRSLIVTLFALLFMGMWIEYQECFNIHTGAFAENAPPNSAVCTILILFAVFAVLMSLRRSFRLTPMEYVFIFTALVVASPLMTQGMWHRFFGLIAAIPAEQDFKSYESLPPMLWPHGTNLITEGRFPRKGLGRFRYRGSKFSTVQWDEKAEWKGRNWTCPVLDNGQDTRGHSELSIRLSRRDAQGREVLTPGGRYLFSLLAKSEGLQKSSAYAITMQADSSPPSNVLVLTGDTGRSLALPYGFERQGLSPLIIPLDLREELALTIAITGPGRLTVHDVQLFDNEAVAGARFGRNMVRGSRLHTLGDHERTFLVIKPDNMFSFAGLRYLASGFIPLRQWGQAAFAWTLLVGALFLGFFGLNVLMRRQWLEYERLSFPQVLLPRELFTEETDARGRPYRPLFRSKAMWAGFILVLVLATLRGLHYYFPSVPVPVPGYLEPILTSNFFTHPLLKAYFEKLPIAFWFFFFSITLLVETDILLSMWLTAVLFQFLYVLGKAFNLERHAGYPWDWQQNIGAFIAYALLAMIIGRKHLTQVFRHLIGRARMDERGEIVSYRTAALMVIGSLALLIAWGLWTRMGWFTSLLFFGFVLICGFTASKIRAEAGPAFAYWFPYYMLGFMGAMGGFAAYGSTGMLIVTICGGFMGTSCFLHLAPVQLEALELGRRLRVRLRDIGSALVIGVLGGLFIGGFVFLAWLYGFGADRMPVDYYNYYWYVRGFAESAQNADRAFLAGTLHTIKENAPLDVIHNIDARGIGIGVVVTALLTALRSALTWFPLHPLGYVLATTFYSKSFCYMLFLAWAVRKIAQRLGGAHAIRRGVNPFAIGMFLGGAASIILMDIIGLIFRAQGLTDIYNNVWP
ncbi:MAG: DUF6785 family protein [Armatimonadota bacterium]